MSKINHHIERLEMHLEHDQSQVIEAIEKVEAELKRVKDYAEHRYEGFISVPARAGSKVGQVEENPNSQNPHQGHPEQSAPERLPGAGVSHCAGLRFPDPVLSVGWVPCGR